MSCRSLPILFRSHQLLASKLPTNKFQADYARHCSRAFVSARLGQDFKNFALIVFGTPKICPLTTNADKNLIKMPGSRRINSAGPDVGGNHRAKFQNPAAHGIIPDINATFRQHFLDVPKTQRKAKIQPNRKMDYCRWKSEAGIGNLTHSHTITRSCMIVDLTCHRRFYSDLIK